MMADCRCHEFREPLVSMADVRRRCEHSSELERYLQVLAENHDTWMAVLACPACGAYWVREYPFSEHHGGGAPADVPEPQVYLARETGITLPLRRIEDDARFLSSLGSETGPEPCRTSGCGRLRISASVHCRDHHFFAIQGRGPAVKP
jgi:hypothetical protein